MAAAATAAGLLDPDRALTPDFWILVALFATIVGPAVLAAGTGRRWAVLGQRGAVAAAFGFLLLGNVAVSLLLPQLLGRL